MKAMIRLILTGALTLSVSLPLLADESATIREALKKVVPDVQIDSIQPSPITGLFEVMVGTQMMYVTGDGRYFIDGRIVDLRNREDLTEPKLAEARLRVVEKLGEDSMIIFDPPGAVRHTITVFTDIECGYCRQFHRQMDGYGQEGIRVRYLFYPRAGEGSAAYDEAVSVWCADDRQAAMTAAKAGQAVPSKRCANPVDRHMALGRELAIRGTPALVLDTGDVIPGYVEPKRLVTILNQNRSR